MLKILGFAIDMADWRPRVSPLLRLCLNKAIPLRCERCVSQRVFKKFFIDVSPCYQTTYDNRPNYSEILAGFSIYKSSSYGRMSI